jgi:hypothetical protein
LILHIGFSQTTAVKKISLIRTRFIEISLKSMQGECRDRLLANWHDRTAAADAKGVKTKRDKERFGVAYPAYFSKG